jgi:hypothetical protein
MNIYRFKQKLCKFRKALLLVDSLVEAITGFVTGGVSNSADSFVVTESFVLSKNISGKKPTIANLQNVSSV